MQPLVSSPAARSASSLPAAQARCAHSRSARAAPRSWRPRSVCACHASPAQPNSASPSGSGQEASLCAAGRGGVFEGRASAALVRRSWAAGLLHADGRAAAAALVLASCAWLSTADGASAAELAHGHPAFRPLAADLNQLAAGVRWPLTNSVRQDDFWSNVGRYGSYFFSVLLGTAYTAVKPIGGLLRKPVTAVFTLAALAALAVFVTSTVRAMLGVGAEFEASSLLLPPQV